MKAIKLITPLFSLLFLLLLSSCMPDSMTKWEENSPVKDDAPVVTVDAPKNYSYSDYVGNTETLSLDVGTTILNSNPIVPNDTFEGENVTFTVSPSLPSGMTFSSTTGVIAGIPDSVTGLQTYTFTATNTGGNVQTTFAIEIKTPETVTSLTYVDQTTGDNVITDENNIQIVNYLEIDKWFRFNPVLSSSSVTWDIDVKVDPADPYVDSADPIELADYPSDCIGKIKVVRGVCLDQTTGALMGLPRDVITVPFEVKITASKTSPASSASATIRMSYLTKPSGLTYSQSSLMELSVSGNPGIVAGQYIKLTDNKGTASTADDTCTFAQIDSTISSSSLLIKKHNSSDRITNSFKVVAYSNALTTPSSVACNATSNVDMVAPATANLTVYQVSNVFEAEKAFTLSPTLSEGEEITYSISPVLPNDTMTSATFDTETGVIKAALKDSYTATSFTITATNRVGYTTATIHIYPIQLPPQDLNYSSQVLLMVRDVSEFNVGDWISTPINNTVSPANATGGYGRVIAKYYEPDTLTSALVVDIEQGKFIGNSTLDNNYPYNAEETSAIGYVKLEVASTTGFSVGDFVSNENIGFGKIRSVQSPYLYVSVLGGVFNADDNIRNNYPYDDPYTVDTTVIDNIEDNLILGHTAILTVMTGNATSAAVTVPKNGDSVTSGISRGVITLAEITPVASLDIADVSNYDIGDTITQGAVSGTVYAKEEGAAPTGTIYVDHIRGGDFILGAVGGTTITALDYGHRFFYRAIKGSFSYGDTIATLSGTTGTLALIEAKNYQAKVTEVGGSLVKIRAGATLSTVNSAGLTGETTGRIVYNDTILSKAHFSVDNGILSPGQIFDTKNPIDQSRAATYPTLTTVSTVQTIVLRRGVQTELFRSLARQVKATYSINPALPKGLSLNTSTGEISGTPSEASLFKLYTVTATTQRGSTQFSFNLKVEEYFEVQLNNPTSRYILHRIGKKSGARACRVYKDQISAGESEEIDVTCYLEAGEADLYISGINFNAISGAGMCNHIEAIPYHYYSYPYYGDSTFEKNKVYKLDMQGGCSKMLRDRDQDGQIDFLITKPKNDGDCFGGLYDDGDGDGDCRDETKNVDEASLTYGYAYDRDGDGNIDWLKSVPAGTGACGALLDSDDGDGDSDCVDDYAGDGNLDGLVAPADPSLPGCPAGTGDAIVDSDELDTDLLGNPIPADGDCRNDFAAATVVDYGVDTVNEFQMSSSIEDETLACISNFTDKTKCDAGKISKKVLSFTPIATNSIYCNIPTVSTTPLDCGGKISQCIAGGIKDFIEDASIDKNVRSKVVASDINNGGNLPFQTIVPIEKSLFNNRYLANFTRNHNFFAIANREADYSFDIKNFNSFFSSSYLMTSDPLGGGYPSYSFVCLDQSYNPKAKIHILVREWDTPFDIRSSIDNNNALVSLGETIASQAGNVFTLTGNVDTTQIEVGSHIAIGDAASGYQFYIVSDVSGTDITVSTTPVRTYVAGTAVYHAPIYARNEMGRIVDTMDTAGMIDPIFGEYYNKEIDHDDTTQVEVSATITSNYLHQTDLVTSSLVADQLPIGTNFTFVQFADVDGDGEAELYTIPIGDAGTYEFTVTAVSGNTITIDQAPGYILRNNNTYIRKSDGALHDTFFKIDTIEATKTKVVVHPITKPFIIDKSETN